MSLEVEDLHVSYGRIPILHGVDFSVRDGQAVGILGHNGMGKTTLLKALIGHLPVRKGTIRFFGEDVTRAPTHRRARAGMGYVPQGRGIFPALSVMDNLRMGCAGVSGSDAAVIERVLDGFPRLKPLLERVGGTLSGGEQQILALARALCGEPYFLLLDEPTEGIQPSIVDSIAETLSELNRTQKLAIVVVEQNLEFLTGIASEVFYIQKGRITGKVDPKTFADLDLAGELTAAS
ncbi:MAG TPA: ABC transporter ATP-binding protein [Hyphomicrobiales bacterium]|nr:ABC transporter ATP-binding protein [Hyphomicrobiales bacterium]